MPGSLGQSSEWTHYRPEAADSCPALWPGPCSPFTLGCGVATPPFLAASVNFFCPRAFRTCCSSRPEFPSHRFHRRFSEHFIHKVVTQGGADWGSDPGSDNLAAVSVDVLPKSSPWNQTWCSGGLYLGWGFGGSRGRQPGKLWVSMETSFGGHCGSVSLRNPLEMGGLFTPILCLAGWVEAPPGMSAP